MKGLLRWGATMEKYKPYIGAVIIQASYGGMYSFSKVVIAKGMNPFVFVFYRQVFATLALAPFAVSCERNKSASLPFKLLCKMFLLSLFGVTMCLNLNYAALKFTTATFSTVMNNTIPAFTFVVAVCLRMESVFIKQKHGMAKVLGLLLCLGGAAVYSFVKGPPLYGHNTTKSSTGSHPKWDWILGPVLTFLANAAWSVWIVLQKPILKEYPSKLRFTTMQSLFSSILSAFVAVGAERNISAFKLRWDVNLLSILYCGVIVAGLMYSLQAWVIEKKGPVFAAQFTPVSLVFAAILSAIVSKEIFHWGSVWGAMLLIIGLYSFLWGKSREQKCETIMICQEQPQTNESPVLHIGTQK